jgi:hypothetical protein
MSTLGSFASSTASLPTMNINWMEPSYQIQVVNYTTQPTPAYTPIIQDKDWLTYQTLRQAVINENICQKKY